MLHTNQVVREHLDDVGMMAINRLMKYRQACRQHGSRRRDIHQRYLGSGDAFPQLALRKQQLFKHGMQQFAHRGNFLCQPSGCARGQASLARVF